MTVTDILLQFAGFLLQTLPIVFLMDVAFDEEQLRYSRKKTVLILLVCDLAFSAAFALAEWLFFANEMSLSFANGFMGLAIIVIYALFFGLIKAPVLNRLIVLVMLTHYAAILFTVNNAVITIAGVSSPHIYGVYGTLFNLVLTVLTFQPVRFFMSRVVHSAMGFSDNKAMKRGSVYIGSAFLLYCAAVLFFDLAFERTRIKSLSIAIFFMAFIITDVILYFMFFTETKLFAQNSRLEDRIRSFDEQYRRISRDIDKVRRLRHDMRHHLNAISAINQKQENRELSEYLEAYSAVYAEIDESVLCGYHALDNILSYYISSAKKKGITVETRLHPLNSDPGFDVTDMTVLIGNLMENAIEACDRLSGSERFIRISIKRSDAELLIKAENSCRADLETKRDYTGSDSFVSTKHAMHTGQGLKSISLIAEKYGGSAEFKRENGVFTARAVLNIP